MMQDEGEFWNRRYEQEGSIWGDDPSPTAVLATRYLRPRQRVLDVGFGYGRDLRLLGKHGCRVSGVELSATGLRKAQNYLRDSGIEPEALLLGRFEQNFSEGADFDALLSHRLAHLLVTPEALRLFAAHVHETLRPGGLLFLAVRDRRDLNPADMNEVAPGVYEYRNRPGHCIRYWDEATFRDTFAGDFLIQELIQESERESLGHPVPCYLSIMVARKKPVDNGSAR